MFAVDLAAGRTPERRDRRLAFGAHAVRSAPRIARRFWKTAGLLRRPNLPPIKTPFFRYVPPKQSVCSSWYETRLISATTNRPIAYTSDDSHDRRAFFPPVAIAGKPFKVRWRGETFDDSPFSVEVPQTDHPTYELHAVDAQGISPSGLPIYLARSTPSSEVEPNNNQKSANELSAPGIAYGVIGKPKDRDFFRFTAKKGQVWEFRVRARTLRSPLDAVLHLYNPQGKYLQGNDDDSGQLDSYLKFKVPADGDYTLDVEDRMLRGSPEMVYVVEIAKPSPVAEMQLEERRRYQAQVIAIPQGGRTAAIVSVKRKNFGGPLQLEFDGLPAGSQAQAVALAKNYNRVPVLFTADAQAKLSATLATLTARLTKKPRGDHQPLSAANLAGAGPQQCAPSGTIWPSVPRSP